MAYDIPTATQAKKSGLKKESVAEAKNNIHSYSDAKFRRDALLGKYHSYVHAYAYMRICVYAYMLK
jgi:hypothetical protein